MRSTLSRAANLAIAAFAISLAFAAPTALDVKASGQKQFFVDGRAGNNQVSVFSQSTLEDFTAVCNKVTGQCTLDPKNVEALAGKFSLRTEDLKTGIELRDTHLAGPDWLDAAKFPEVVITVTKTQDVKVTQPNTATLTLVGTCSIRGQTKDIAIPATLTYLDESPETMKRVRGDLFRLRSDFHIKLSDYGVTGPKGSDTIGLKVSDDLEVRATIFGSTEKPPAAVEADKKQDVPRLEPPKRPTP